MACFSIQYLHQYLPLSVYEVAAIGVNTTKSTYTFTSMKYVHFNGQMFSGILEQLSFTPTFLGKKCKNRPFLRKNDFERRFYKIEM